MDKKLKERIIVDHIYGDLPLLELIDSESPDFLAKFSDQFIFGVEVTELHATDTHSKIQNDNQYHDGLIDGSRKVCRADKSIAEVLKADLMLPNGQTQKNTRVLILEGLSFIQAATKLGESIRKKIIKTEAYKKQCQLIDLVVYDEHSLFQLNTVEDMQHYLYDYIDNDMLHQSSLREVYFITDILSIGKIALPLRLNHFLGDTLSLLHLAQNELITGDKLSIWKVVLAALHVIGHRKIYFGYRTDFMTIQFGAWEISLSHGNVNITELATQPTRFKLSNEAQKTYESLDENFLETLKLIINKRSQVVRYLPTYKTLTI
ncbi:hypothetical protein [Rheinheimera sp. NSM]|uniref:hypothetical protein n=1 Tax=Rheinheimera sp. NSM TaxID=3457884 RepID=UPI004035DAEF